MQMYPTAPRMVRTANGEVIRTAGVHPDTTDAGTLLVRLADVNHVHADERPECGVWSKRGAFKVVTVNSARPFATRLREIYLERPDGTLLVEAAEPIDILLD